MKAILTNGKIRKNVKWISFGKKYVQIEYDSGYHKYLPIELVDSIEDDKPQPTPNTRKDER